MRTIVIILEDDDADEIVEIIIVKPFRFGFLCSDLKISFTLCFFSEKGGGQNELTQKLWDDVGPLWSLYLIQYPISRLRKMRVSSTCRLRVSHEPFIRSITTTENRNQKSELRFCHHHSCLSR